MLDWLSDPLSYRFMRLALAEVVIVGVVAGFLGAYVVTRGLAFVGDAIAHAVIKFAQSRQLVRSVRGLESLKTVDKVNLKAVR